MNAFVIDSNVPIVASERSEHAGMRCVLECIDALIKIQRGERVVLDDGLLILNEYRRKLSLSGQPGVGDGFFKWLWQNQANPEHCERVPIHPRGETPDDFEEFPDDPELKKFDHNDRKFVAVARASLSDPTILDATDSDWWDYRAPLKKHGLKISFICPEHVVKTRKHVKKPRRK